MIEFVKKKIFTSESGQRKYRSKYEKVFETIYLSREIAKSEFIRIKFLCTLSWLCFFFFLFFYLFFYEEWEALSPYKVDITNVPIFTGLLSLYYSFFLFLIKICKWNEKQEPISVRVLSCCIEASIPSILLFLLALPVDFSYVNSAPQILLYIPFIILSALRLDFRLCFLMALVSSASYLAVVYHFLGGKLQFGNLPPALNFPHTHILFKTFLLLLTAVCTAYVTKQIRNKIFDTFAYLQERNAIEQLLETHVSSGVANEIIYNQNIDQGEEYSVSILFFDIRNFTTYAENETPKNIFSFLNYFFIDILSVIHKNNGIINKFLGDGFMAVFGAPLVNKRHAEQAIRAALGTREIVMQKNKKRKKSPVRIGIGIHSGKVIGGNIGSDIRKEYSIIGDTVNIASRIEQLNKVFHSDILVSKKTIEKSGRAFPCESVGEHVIKGKTKPVEVFKLL